MEIALTYRHRAVTRDEVAFIRQLIAEHPEASRCALSKKLCRAWNWVQANGNLRDMVCRGLMLELHRAGWIELPPVRKRPNNPLAKRSRPALVAVDTQPLQVKLAELQPLTVRQVRRAPEEPLFNSLIEQHHYLGYSQPVGEHLKFLVYAQDRPIACLAFSSAPRHLGSRDRFIGWSREARLANIRLIAYNTRYLLVPWVSVEHLASHLLGRIARMISAEWQRLYGHPIYFLETFVDPQRFRGTCYRAANWIYLGDTTGRGKDAPTHKPNRPLKQVLGYPLVKDFRRRLQSIAGTRCG
jgi:Druantia protein DruA